MFKASLSLGLLLLSMTARPAAAQIVNLAGVDLPFNVTVAGVAMSAGHYTILSVMEESGRPLLVFRPDHGRAIEVLAKQVAEPENSRTEIVVGKTHEIQKLWIEGQSEGYEFERR